MPVHAERRALPYSQQQIYRMVSDIERYPDFLPWCLGVRTRNREGNVLLSDMVIGFRMFRESFTSRVTLTPHSRIDVTYVDGALKSLSNRWEFVALPDHTCEVNFYVEFEFQSRLLQRMIGSLFQEAIQRMVGSFELRAAVLYGETGGGVPYTAT